jgi:hypothetical protein
MAYRKGKGARKVKTFEEKKRALDELLAKYPPEGVWLPAAAWWWICAGAAGFEHEEAGPLFEAWKEGRA